MERVHKNNKPIADFISTATFEKAKELLVASSVLFLHGLSGSGKTEIAKALGEEHERLFLIGCTDVRSMKNCLIEHCHKENLKVSFPTDCYPLDRILDSDALAGWFLILDDVEDIDRVLISLRRERWNRNPAKIVVTTQKKLAVPNFSIRSDFESELKVEGFTRDEARRFLPIPDNRLDELIENIGLLPMALSAFKGALLSHQSDSMDDFISRYIADMNKAEKNPALRCIMEGLKRALADNPFYEKLVKHLSMFSRNDITVDILVALIEELGGSEGFAVANHFVNRLDNRSLCVISQSDTDMIFVTIHNLVKKAMGILVKEDELAEIIRHSLQAFSRIMPLDGRNHRYFNLPKMLEHALSLREMVTKVNEPSMLTKLLNGQLLTSIGYCMMSHRHDTSSVIETLEDGLDVFLKLFSNSDCRNFEDVDVDGLFLSNPGNGIFEHDEQYRSYIRTLQRLQRITPRDFETLFEPEKYDEFDEKLKDGHLTDFAIEKLLAKKLLLKEDILAKIYPLELLAFHFHMVSRAHEIHFYGNPQNLGKAVINANKADAIYERLNKDGVPLLGMYVNKRHLLNLQKDGDIDSLSSKWEALRKADGNAYECGMARIINLKEDEYHELLCSQGQLFVCGRKAKNPNQRESALRESQDLIKKIIYLSEKHKKKHLTLCRSYQQMAKFYENYDNFSDANRCLITSLMEYNLYCLESQRDKSREPHPELDDDKRKKFDTIYEQLKRNVKGLTSSEPYRETRGDAVGYINSLVRNWQERCKRSQADDPQAIGTSYYNLLLSMI